MSNLSRRAFLSAFGLSILASTASVPAWADSARPTGTVDSLVFEGPFFKVYRGGNTFSLVEASGATTIYVLNQHEPRVDVMHSDGSTSVITVDEQGFGLIDGVPIGEVLYQRSPDDPVTYGCVLMSTRKMTVKEAAAPSEIAMGIIGALLPESNWIGLAWEIANQAFEWQVDHHADMYVIMKHWYCDSPKMITRKDFYLYSDKACTNLVKSWSVEAPVGVN